MSDSPKILLDEAVMLAEHAHRHQKDKSGSPYIEHPRRVMEMANSNTDKIVAILHDTVEDCGVKIEYIRSAFGDEIADAVYAISKKPSERLTDYYNRVQENEIALRVKLLDIADNSEPKRLLLLDSKTQERLITKYANAFRILKGL